MVDADIARCIACFGQLGRCRDDTVRTTNAAFKRILDEKLSDLRDKYEIKAGGKLGMALRSILSEVNPLWDTPEGKESIDHLPMKTEKISTAPRTKSPKKKTSASDQRLALDILGREDDGSTLECNQARPCVVDPMIPAPPVGPRWEEHLYYQSADLGETHNSSLI